MFVEEYEDACLGFAGRKELLGGLKELVISELALIISYQQ